MKKLKIFSFPDKNPEYLQLQIDSYKKYMKSDEVEFVVINASNDCEKEITKICDDNRISCVQYTGKRDVPWSHYYVEQLNWFRDEIQSKSNDFIMLIHSDMFFINKIDYKNLLKDKKIYLNPQYRNNQKSYDPPNGYEYFYMWDGVVLFDSEFFNESNLTRLFNWDYLPVSDVGGQTYKLLQELSPNDCGFFEFWNFGEIKETSLDTHLNGNIRAIVDMSKRKTFLFGQPEEYKHDRLFAYQNKSSNLSEKYADTFLEIYETFIKKFGFPNPASIDVIQTMDSSVKNSFVLHLKSGSRSYDKNYISSKLEAIKNVIFRE